MIRQVHWFVFIEFYLPSICLFPLIFISADSVANVFSCLQLFFHFLKAIWIHSILWVLNPEMSGSCVYRVHYIVHCVPCGSHGKAAACNVGDLGSIPGLGRSSGEGNGNPLHYSCLENFMDGEAWKATVQGWPRVGHDWVTSLLCILDFSAPRVKGFSEKPYRK